MIRQACIGTVAALALSLGAACPGRSARGRYLKPAATNPTTPQMGDHLENSEASSANTGANKAIDGVIAWISLVQVDKGKEQPVDLEDWSAHKAVSAEQMLLPGATD